MYVLDNLACLSETRRVNDPARSVAILGTRTGSVPTVDLDTQFFSSNSGISLLNFMDKGLFTKFLQLADDLKLCDRVLHNPYFTIFGRSFFGVFKARIAS